MVGNPVRLRKAKHVLLEIHRDPDDLDVAAYCWCMAMSSGISALTRFAPGRPEVEHQRVAAVIAGADAVCRCCPATQRPQVASTAWRLDARGLGRCIRDALERGRRGGGLRVGINRRTGRRAPPARSAGAAAAMGDVEHHVVDQESRRSCSGNQHRPQRRRGRPRQWRLPAASNALALSAANSGAFMNPTTRYGARSCPSTP